ncbi:MAG: methyltransferase domain-containing protein [Ruminococcaceae bacterium]|nr:methyltransferase domain-containing protein [Oscillospiraceae bacterium]
MEDFEVLSCGMRVLQTDDLFRLGTDSILLSNFASPLRGRRIADLGAGGSALGVLLCAANEKCEVTGIEIQEKACDISRKNIEINGLHARLHIMQGDLREIRTLLPANSFDTVISNPPYFPVGSGAQPEEPAFAIARTETCCTLNELCSAAAWLLRYGGSFYLVHRPERLAEIIYLLKTHHLEPKRLRFVRHHPTAAVSLALIESRSGGKSGLQIENDLILFDENGAQTREYREIYHMP